MGGFRMWAAAAAVGVAAIAGPAAAVTRQMTFSGQMASLNDETHLFAPGGFGDVADKSFTAVLTFDLPSPSRVKTAANDLVFGGLQVGKPVFVTGRLSFAGVNHAFAAGLFNSVGVGIGAAGGELRGLVDGEQEALTLNANFASFPAVDLGVDFMATADLVDSGSGFRAWNSAGGGEALGVLFIDRVSLGDAPAAAAVPEPASWALMILGFGAVGAAVRRRRVAA